MGEASASRKEAQAEEHSAAAPLDVSRLRSSSMEIREKGSEFLKEELYKAQKVGAPGWGPGLRKSSQTEQAQIAVEGRRVITCLGYMPGPCCSPGNQRGWFNPGASSVLSMRPTTEVSEVLNVFIPLDSSGNLLPALVGGWARVFTLCMG